MITRYIVNIFENHMETNRFRITIHAYGPALFVSVVALSGWTYHWTVSSTQLGIQRDFTDDFAERVSQNHFDVHSNTTLQQ